MRLICWDFGILGIGSLGIGSLGLGIGSWELGVD